MDNETKKPTVSNPLEHVVSCADVLALSSDSLAVNQLMQLNGQSFNIKKERSRWKVMTVIADKVTVTSVKASVEILKDKIIVSGTTIYCNFYLDGVFLYNAWLSLESMQEYITAAIKHNPAVMKNTRSG